VILPLFQTETDCIVSLFSDIVIVLQNRSKLIRNVQQEEEEIGHFVA
jgi:hypothetical protein